MRMQYDWIFTEPGERLVAHMNTVADGKPFFDATLQLERREWTRRELHRTLAAYPLMTMRVIGGIHWEALKLWAKGVPVFSHVPKGSEAMRQRTEESSEVETKKDLLHHESWVPKQARKIFFESLRDLRDGYLEIVCPDETYTFGGRMQNCAQWR